MPRRTGEVAIVTILLMVVGATTVTSQPIRRDPLEVVRSTDSELRGLIVEAYAHSATVRRLVEEIRVSQWLVFVQAGRCPSKPSIACLLHHVGTFEGSQYLRVVVDHRRRRSDSVIGSLAHELQHVVEVIREPGVTDGHAIRALFRRIGKVSVQSLTVTAYETETAQRIGGQVIGELRRSSTFRSAQP